MRKIILAIVAILLIASSYEACSQVQIYARYSVEGKVEPDINLFGTKKITEKFQLSYFFLVEQNWAEGLIGLSYSPVEWATLNFSVGLETNPHLLRLSASCFLAKGDFSLFANYEIGGGKANYWYKVVFSYNASKKVSTGMMAWRFHGIGPFISLKLKELDTKLWVNPTYDLEFKVARIMIGIDIEI